MILHDLSQLPDSFKSGYRGIILLHRNKEGAKGNAQRKAFKGISKDKCQWEEIVLQFHHLQKTSHIGYRIYSSVNSRNMAKAVHEFKRRQLEVDYGNNHNMDVFYRDIENTFFSCMMNPSCRVESNFLIDCDTNEEYLECKEKVPEDLIILDYATKNGRHLITKPFNPNEILVKIKKDELLYIG